MSTVRTKQKQFLSSPQFAVVGASKDQSKFGTKVLQWYKARGKAVTPIHPRESELEGLVTVASVAELSTPSETSISVVTPPKVTLGVLEKAKELAVPAIWIQPGAEDETVINWLHENGMEGRVIYGGPCILVEGDSVANSLL